jgi:hypothetical protein
MPSILINAMLLVSHYTPSIFISAMLLVKLIWQAKRAVSFPGA